MTMAKRRDKAVMDGIAAGMASINRGKVRPRPSTSRSLDASLRNAIKASGMTHYALGQVAGVAPSQIDRFMLPTNDPRHRDMRLATASRIAAALGLVLSGG